MKLLRCLTLALLTALLFGSLQYAPTRVHAEGSDGTGPWYRYQGEPSSYDKYGNQQVNCGPTSVAMAIQFAKHVSVPIRDIRQFIGKNSEYTSHSDLTSALGHWGVAYKSDIYNAQSITSAISKGDIAIVLLDMRKISNGADVNGASADPSQRTGRFETVATLHWIVVKGISSDGQYFIVYDGNVWGGPGDSTYWYSDGTPKGLDRYYKVSEVQAGMYYFGQSSLKGVEIAPQTGAQAQTGQQVKAQITYYSLTPQETGKTPSDPEWGIMYDGHKVHWGAVAVDPAYIPLGTKMKINGWGDQVFVAEDTGSAVKGWHVDIFWPGTHDAAARENDIRGGVRTVTLLGPAPAFTDAAAVEPPTGASISIETNGGFASSRWVTLHLSASDPKDKLSGMMISNNEYFTDAFEEPYAPTKQWTLQPGDGPKTVYARFKNSQGAWSETAQVSVNLQEQPPVGVVTVAPDPRIIVSAPLSGTALSAVGPRQSVQGYPQYQPLGPNILYNSSFELWAGGIPDGWDSDLRDSAYKFYEPEPGAYHGSLALHSDSSSAHAALVQKVLLQPNTYYTLSAQVQGAGAHLGIDELQSQGVQSRLLASHSVVSKAGSGWQLLSLTFKSSAETTDAAISIYGSHVLWDAIQLAPGKQPSRYMADGVLLQPAAENYVPNGSAERGVLGWTGLNSWVEVVSSPDYARFGRRAVLVRKLKSGIAATVLPVHLVPGRQYTFSVYARLDTGGAITNGQLRGWLYQGVGDTQGIDFSALSDSNRPSMTWRPVGGDWYRGAFTFKATATQGLYGVMSTDVLRVGDVYYLDGAQIEEGSQLTSYIDGSLGPGYSWESAPYRSSSLRAPVTLSYGKTSGTTGSLAFWARPEGSAPAGSELLHIGSLSLQITSSTLALYSGAHHLATTGWTPGPARLFVVTWDGQSASFYADGKLVRTVAAAAPSPGSLVVFGDSKTGSSANAVVGDLSLWRVALGPSDVAGLATNSPLDPGLPEVNSRHTQVATNATDFTPGKITIEWSEDGQTWHPWSKVSGLHDWDLGSGQGTKLVWVRFTDSAGNWLSYADQVILDTDAPHVAKAVMQPNGDVQVTFSEPVRPDSLLLIQLTSDSKPLAGKWSYQPGETQATFTPKHPASRAVISVGKGLLDIAGNHLAPPYKAVLTRP